MNLTLKSGYTPTFTGGTDVTLSVSSQSGDIVELVDFSEPDFRLRSKARVTVSQPSVDSRNPTGYSQSRSKITLSKGKILDNGSVSYNSIAVNMGFDFTLVTTDRLKMIEQLAYFLLQNKSALANNSVI